MSIAKHPAQMKVVDAYNAAADHFDEAPLAFWDRHGQRTVGMIGLRAGDEVLDVGCGTGASALPAALAVGPRGHVTGIDVAENMLVRARQKANEFGLGNTLFRCADMSDAGFPDESFDAVISVFSVFFVSDIEGQIAEFWRLLRPGGRLAVTVWGRDAFEPWVSVFGEELNNVRPDLVVKGRPWERLTDPEGLRRAFADSGVAEPTVQAVRDRQSLPDPEDWWSMALGGGFRWEIDQLSLAERKVVKANTLGRLSEIGARAMETGANYGNARKPA